MTTTTFALFRNKDTGEQRIIQCHDDNIVVAAELAELANKAARESHLLVVWTTKGSAMCRPAWTTVWEIFCESAQAPGVYVENSGGRNEVYLFVGETIAEGKRIISDFRRRFASRLN
jgi:hypothetical protein